MSEIIDKGDKVKVHYTLKLDNGDVVDSSKGKDALEFEAGSGTVIKGFDENIIGLKKGDAKVIKVAPENGYGEKQDKLIQIVPIAPFRKSQNKDPEINMVLTLSSKDGQKLMARVIKIDGDKMTLDLNHILAGENLNFDVKIVDVTKKLPKK